MKKILILVLLLSLTLSLAFLPSVGTFAQTGIEENPEAQSMQRLMDLGIFAKTAPDQMDLGRLLTREELASILIQANGQQDKLSLYKDSSLYSDVPKTRWSNTAVQAAVKLGYMAPMPDGKFHPADRVSFAMAATILGNLLKYDDDILSGSYPQNYLSQLSNLNILDGISYTAAGSVTRGQIAMMVDRLFNTKVFGTDQTFVETISTYKSAIVFENSILDAESDERRVVTNKGTFYLKDGLGVPQAGKQYIFRMKDKEIQYAALTGFEFQELSVKSFSAGRVTTNIGEKIILPAGITYYYKGKATDYETVSASMAVNSSVIICRDRSEAVYGALFDPLYSSPEVITDKQDADLAKIRFGDFTIEKSGKYISASEIDINDVVYKVTDIWGRFGYAVVSSNTVSGKITAILPNKISPVSIEINGKSYDIDEGFPKEKINASGLVQTGETARLILGVDGKVVDLIMDSVEGTNSYALVLNAYTQNSVKPADFGVPHHYVTLLHSNGGKKTYLADSSMSSLRGRLVTFELAALGEDFDTVLLDAIDNNSTVSYSVNKEERMLGDSYVANGAVLFNIENTAPVEIEASVVSFGDLPSGALESEKVKYVHKSGDFMDIDVMLLYDALDKNSAYGIVTSKKTTVAKIGSENVTTETVTIMVNGQILTYAGGVTGVSLNQPIKVRLNGNSVRTIEYGISAAASGNEIEAVDLSRIRLNGKVYTYHKDLSIYKETGSFTWKKLEPSDLTKGSVYGSITVYLDKPVASGGKVVLIVLK